MEFSESRDETIVKFSDLSRLQAPVILNGIPLAAIFKTG